MRSSACDTLIRLCVRHVLCWLRAPLPPARWRTWPRRSSTFVGDAGIDDFLAALFPVPLSPLVADRIDEPLSRGKPALQSVVAPPLVCDLHDCPHAPQGCAFARFRAFTNKHREQVRVVPAVFNQVIGGAAHCVSGERSIEIPQATIAMPKAPKPPKLPMVTL